MDPSKPAERGVPPIGDNAQAQFAPAQALRLRHMVGIAVVTPMLLVAGVLWLRYLPAGVTSKSTDAAVEVTLVSQDPAVQPQDLTPPSKPHPPVSQPEALLENAVRSIPQDEHTDTPDQTTAQQQPSPTQKKSTPAPPTAHAQLRADQAALAFQRTLLSHIARYRRYPDDAQREGIHGTAMVLFAMRRDGTVTDVWIRRTSGNKQLDAAAVDTIRRAVPLPNIPSELPEDLNVLLPVAFNLP